MFFRLWRVLMNNCDFFSVCLSPKQLCSNIAVSFIPPFTAKYRKISVDLLGPALATVILIVILNFGNTYRKVEAKVSSFIVVLLYMLFMPVFCFILNAVGQSWLTFSEIVALIGYALYGHILTLLLAFCMAGDVVFFGCLAVFGGLSMLRVILLQLQALPHPGVRLLVCSAISVVHILFLVFLYYGFIHPDFDYENEWRGTESS